MIIIDSTKSTNKWRHLRSCIAGCVVQFRVQFHQDNCRDGDYFLICNGNYRPEGWGHQTAVVNIRTGTLSYVDSARDVEIMRATCEIKRCGK